MDKQLVWKDEFNIGVEAIDKEHQRLFSIINRLFTLRKEEQKSGKACEEGIRFFYFIGKFDLRRTHELK